MKRSCLALLALVTAACSSEMGPGDVVTTDTPGGETAALDVPVAPDASDSGLDVATVDAVDAVAAEASADAPTDAGPLDATGTGCNSIVNSSPAVTVSHIDGMPPTQNGGALVDGRYFLTGRTAYRGAASGCTGAGHPEVLTANAILVISGSGTMVQGVSADNTHGDAHFSVGLRTTGTTATLSVTCPTTSTVTGPYTAEASRFSMYDTATCFYDTYNRAP